MNPVFIINFLPQTLMNLHTIIEVMNTNRSHMERMLHVVWLDWLCSLALSVKNTGIN
jgi:hypothetical protein